MRYLSLFVAAIMVFAAAPLFAQDASPVPTPPAMSESQRAEVESIIRDYLVNKHPEVLMEAMRELQRRDQANAETKSREAISNLKDKIFNNPDTPTGGNPKGDVTVVEFFDYQCGYCKMSEEGVQKLLKDDKNIKFVYKDFPILGPMSVVAAKASLASVRQGKYVKFHDALMMKKEHLTDDIIYQVAKDVGLDVDKLKKDMNDAQTNGIVDANLKLGNDVGVRGTPMFIVNEQVYPGALQYDQLKKAVDDARTGSKK